MSWDIKIWCQQYLRCCRYWHWHLNLVLVQDSQSTFNICYESSFHASLKGTVPFVLIILFIISVIVQSSNHFGRIHFRKLHFQKIHFRKRDFRIIHFQKHTFGKYTFRKYSLGKYTFRKYSFKKYTFTFRFSLKAFHF